MPRVKLTDNLLRKVERPSSGTITFWDSEIRGFVAHVQKTTITLYFNYNNSRHLIGRFPSVTLPLARQAARELDYRLRKGFAKNVQQSNPRLSEMVEQYCARPKLRSEKWKDSVRHAIDKNLKWNNRRALDITPAMCADSHQRLFKRGPTVANQTLQALNTIWNFCRKQDPSLPESPAQGLEWYPESKSLNAPIRDLKTWAQEVEKIQNQLHRTAYHFALFTGLRRGEIETLEWSRIIDNALYFPETKSGREFWLPLVDHHLEILQPLRDLDEKWIFPANSKTGHVVAWNHDHVPGTLHSLRHTFATTGFEAGLPEEVVGRLLNHSSRTITGQRYVKPNLDFLRSAMQIIVDELQKRLDTVAH